jgi:hypothetical protein
MLKNACESIRLTFLVFSAQQFFLI